jgi:ribosomal protein S18 acetylase RimI-like enzyme
MSALPIKIRRSGAEDVRILLEIDQICFPADVAFSRDEIASYLNHPKSIAWVAERAGRILGYVMAHIENDRFAHIVTLDIIPEARRQKIGTTLMNRMHKELRQRGVNVFILEVGVENSPAQMLYEKLQYQYLERLSGYYHGRQDAYRMARFFK